jgi:hypothetical protein
VSIILDALRKAEEDKKLQQPSPEIDIEQQILSHEKETRQESPSPLNKKFMVAGALALTGLAVFGIYSLMGGPKKERPVEQALNMPPTPPSTVVANAKPAPTIAVAPPSESSPAPLTVVAAPPPPVKTAPAQSPVFVAPPPSDVALEGQKENTAQKVVEKAPSKAVFGPPDVETQHQVIPSKGAAFSLEGIIFHPDPDKRMAIMHLGVGGNEATVRIGDSLGTWLVKDIELDKVTLLYNDKRIVLKLE